MSRYESLGEALGAIFKPLYAGCADPEAPKALLSLSPKPFDFPSLDAMQKQCEVLPRVRDIQANITSGFKGFSREYGQSIEYSMIPLREFLLYTEKFMTFVPWPIMIISLVGLAYFLTRKVGVTLLTALTLFFMGWFGMWTEAMQTISFITVCAIICIAAGIPIGIWMSRSDRVQNLITPILDFLQTLPSFVYLIPVLMLFGIGKIAGAISVIFYAIPPVIRLTNLGIRLVDKEVLEAADAFGSSRRQRLFDVQIPLAMPTIMAGVNQTIMMALAMVVIASMVSVKGLGMKVLKAITEQELGLGVFYGTAIVLLAIIFDRVTKESMERTQRHMKSGHH